MQQPRTASYPTGYLAITQDLKWVRGLCLMGHRMNCMIQSACVPGWDCIPKYRLKNLVQNKFSAHCSSALFMKPTNWPIIAFFLNICIVSSV